MSNLMPTEGVEQEPAAGPSKSALKKAAKEAEKAKKKAETAARLAMQRVSLQEAESVDHSEGSYGVLPLIQSTSRTGIWFLCRV
jgi:aspartyl-tRNA synthetase